MRNTFMFPVAALVLAGSIFAADLSEFKTADDLWRHIKQLERGPSKQPTSEEEARKIFGEFFTELDGAVTAFVKQYPSDTRRWEAKETQFQVAMMRAQLDGKEPDLAAAETVLKEIAAAEDAPADTKADASFTLIQIHAEAAAGSGDKAKAEATDAEIQAFQKQNPDDRRSSYLKMVRANLFATADPAKAERILKELSEDKDQQIATQAKAQLDQLELTKKPIELSFTALSGDKVDLTKLRGKVVLIDFWATWCGPCVQEVPNVVATYKKYHDKGFEIVGISLDDNKDRVMAFTKDKGMTWQQHFDGQGFDNEISRRFGITGIPTMWLLDKGGNVKSTDARGHNLAKLIEKLLAE